MSDMRMPVLDKLSRETQESLGAMTEDIVVLHINHCMDNSFYFSEVLNRMFHDVIFIGAPYNGRGMEGNYSFRYLYGKNRKGSYELYDRDQCFKILQNDFTAAMEALITQAITTYIIPYIVSGKRLLIFEDGGYHYPVLEKLSADYGLTEDCVVGCVEQTASGTVRCRDYGKLEGFRYPCASISRSEIKMGIESRFIGHRVTEELGSFLYSANTFWDFHSVLLIGYGIVGRRVAMDLREKKCRITVYDDDAYIREIAETEGYDVLSEITPGYFQKTTIIVGNTGTSAFTVEMLTSFLHGKASEIYLASSSSQDREFKVFLDMVNGNLPFPTGTVLCGTDEQEYYTIYHLRYREQKKKVYLIAEGLPVNFYRKDGISLTYSIIDLVFSEMLSMGITLCREEQLPRRLYLLGEDDGFLPFLSEEELLRLWFETYGLSCGGNLKESMDMHPATGYLRKKLIQEDTDGKTSCDSHIL